MQCNAMQKVKAKKVAMDVYVAKIISNGSGDFKIEVHGDELTKEENNNDASPPYIDWILKTRKSKIYGITLELHDDVEKKNKKQNGHWNVLSVENDFCVDDVTHSVSYKSAADILLKASDELPAAGSYLLNIYWDIRGFEDFGQSIGSVTPVLGALRKLCSWHGGHLQFISNGEIIDRIWSIASFIDRNASIIDGSTFDEEQSICLRQDNMWHGSLDILSQGTPLHSLPGFTLSRHNVANKPEIQVSYGKADTHETDTNNMSFTEEPRDHAWFDPTLTLLEYVDVSTIPLILLSGKKFILRYHINEKLSEDRKKVEILRDILNSSSVGAFLCSIDYAISNNEFESIPEYSSKNWQNAVLKNSNNLEAPKYRFLHEFRLLQLLLMQSENDRSVVEENGKEVIQFSAHILHRASELNFEPYIRCEDWMTKTLGSCDSDNRPICSMLDNLRSINPAGLFYKDENFNVKITSAIKRWTETNSTSTIPDTELRKIVEDTSMQLRSEQESILRDSTNVPKDTSTDLKYTMPTSDTLHKMQLLALSNRDKIKSQVESSKMRSVKSSDSIRSTATAKPIDMHLKPFDILQHFSLSGQPKNISFIDSKSEDRAKPSPGKLKNFDEALKLSYHGISYNIDERAAEKHDRMCRRLVERQVKFETSSIGSDEKVPSPATLNIADSPFKRSSLANDSTTSKVSDTQKRMQLQKVAEKLYKKRIRSRGSVASTSSVTRMPSTSSMVLRSTPTKAKNTMGLRSASTSESNSRDLKKEKIQPNKEPVSEEEKRLRRRTYVQDNKKRLQDLVTQALLENGITKDSKRFNTCSKRLYNVSMAFLRDLKTSKDLDKIMKQTVSNNVHSVISFNAK